MHCTTKIDYYLLTKAEVHQVQTTITAERNGTTERVFPKEISRTRAFSRRPDGTLKSGFQ